MIHKMMLRLRYFMVGQCVLILMLLTTFSDAYAQLPVTHNEDFDSIGTSVGAVLPAEWRVDKQSAVRTLGSYASAGAATELRAGNNMASNAPNGIYNFGAGVAASAPDRAPGWLSSGGGTQSGNLYARFQNDTGASLASVTISYDVEKYRNGTNPAGFRVQMYYSTDGATWTSAGPAFLTSFAADADNNGFVAAPGATESVIAQVLIFSSPISVGGDFYLAWNYSATSGSTTTNAQALAVDDFSIGSPLAVTLADFGATQQGDAVLVTWETSSELDNLGFNLYRATSPAGSTTQLNAALIPSLAPGSTAGFVYTWEDRADLVAGQTYYYWLEDVALSGATRLHGPVSAAYLWPTAVTLVDLQAGSRVDRWPLAVALASLAVLAGAAVQCLRLVR